MTRGSFTATEGLSQQMTSPKSSTSTRSATLVTSAMSCSIMMIVRSSSRLALSTQLASSAVSAPFMPATGSSSRSSLGRIASARASSMRFFTPYGSSRTISSRMSSRPISSSNGMQSRRASYSSRRARPNQNMPLSTPAFMKWWRPSTTLSRTVISSNNARFWNVRAMPRRAMSAGLRPSRDWPSNSTLPDVGL